MLEMFLGPKRALKNPISMLFIGLIYASLSMLLVNFIFSEDVIMTKYSGILIVTFSVMFSLPFMYYLIKDEEEKDTKYDGFFKAMKQHKRALTALLWLFIGFIIAFSFWHILLNNENSFRIQIEVFCQINNPGNIDACVSQYTSEGMAKTTAFLTSKEKIFAIFSNNIYVLIFTLIFSLIFGAGAIFVLSWNASIIAAAIGIYTKSSLNQIPIGILRYMIHGLPEIGAYFIGALAGGIIGVAVIRHDTRNEKFWNVLQDSLNLIILAVVILFLAALIEVFITPMIFR